MNIFTESFPSKDYFVVTYWLRSTKTLAEAAWDLAIGQSVGNPNERSVWETEELFQNHSCLILADKSELETKESGKVKIAFPLINIDLKSDGVSHLLCQIMGGQLDIAHIKECHVLGIEFPEQTLLNDFMGPKYGIDGIRKFVKVFDKPLVGGIVKPKTGFSPELLLDMVKELVEGGINFIKEDEILSNPQFCRIKDRLPKVANYLADKNVVYAAAINADPIHVIDRVKLVHNIGINAVHVNFWCGMGVYKSIRELDLPMFLHFQKSGDKILTNPKHNFHISWDVVCQLASLMGADFIHAGMWGGYMSDNEESLKTTLAVLRTGGTMPALSCGMHPGLIQATAKRFGSDFMANAGGAIHAHPAGTKAGTRAMIQAVAGLTGGQEYKQAIAKWGLVE